MSQPARRILLALSVFMALFVFSPTHRALANTPAVESVSTAFVVQSVQVVEQAVQVKVTVVRGDTLSGIHSKVCGNGNWQTTWKENPFITNANLIYPGQVVVLSCTAVATPAPQAPTQPAEQASSGGWVVPVTACNISGFRTSQRPSHDGVDLAAGYGTPIRAASAGTVSVGYQAGGAGNYSMINHGGGVYTVYMHQSSFAVTSGYVATGQVIGYVGATGDAQGPHLHFEVHTGGLWSGKVNPVSFLANRGAYIC